MSKISKKHRNNLEKIAEARGRAELLAMRIEAFAGLVPFVPVAIVGLILVGALLSMPHVVGAGFLACYGWKMMGGPMG